MMPIEQLLWRDPDENAVMMRKLNEQATRLTCPPCTESCEQELHSAALTGETRQHPWGVVEGWREGWWGAEPDVGRVADGVAARVDRLKAIGNGQVPQCAAEAWRLLTANVKVSDGGAFPPSA